MMMFDEWRIREWNKRERMTRQIPNRNLLIRYLLTTVIMMMMTSMLIRYSPFDNDANDYTRWTEGAMHNAHIVQYLFLATE